MTRRWFAFWLVLATACVLAFAMHLCRCGNAIYHGDVADAVIYGFMTWWTADLFCRQVEIMREGR